MSELSKQLEKVQDLRNIDDNIILFKLEKFSNLFFSKLFNKIKLNNLIIFNNKFNIIALDLVDLDFNQIKSNLEINFLGKKTIYFFKDFFLLQENKKRDLYNYFIGNNFSNNLFIIFDDQNSNITDINFFNININYKINIELYIIIYNFFYKDFVSSSKDKYFIERLFEKFKFVTLDQALQIMHYQILLSNKSNIDYFIDNWLLNILKEELSLFYLSGYLFEKNINNFFDLWLKFKNNYTQEFWTIYWADQIYNAAIFLIKAKENLFKAKQESNKLPFSFINKYYKNYDYQYLLKAHNFLYNIDYSTKNNLGANIIELWFYKFLYNLF